MNQSDLYTFCVNFLCYFLHVEEVARFSQKYIFSNLVSRFLEILGRQLIDSEVYIYSYYLI